MATDTESASAKPTTDHEEIRRWAESRSGRPACVRDTRGAGSGCLLRIDFPGYSGEDTLEEISWDEFFRTFDDNNLVFLCQDRTADGGESRFFKFVERSSVEGGGARSGGGGARRAGGGARKSSASARGGSAKKGASARKASKTGSRSGAAAKSSGAAARRPGKSAKSRATGSRGGMGGTKRAGRKAGKAMGGRRAGTSAKRGGGR